MIHPVLDEALVFVMALGLAILTPLATASMYYYGRNVFTVEVAAVGLAVFVLTALLPAGVLAVRQPLKAYKAGGR